MSEAVEKIIIGPMLALYPPPSHLRDDAGRRAAALAEYRHALDRFDGPTLAVGWERVVAEHQYWVWPNPGLIAAACAQSLPPPPAVSDQDRRRSAAIEMAEDYTARFLKTTHQAALARAEGWFPRLAEYVREAAWAQTQLLVGVKPVGFSAVLIPREHRHLTAGDAFARYRETIDGALRRGRVRVTVPPALVREWRGPGVERHHPAPARG